MTTSAELLYSSAAERDIAQTAEALEQLEANLSDTQHSGLSHLGQVLWEAAGGEVTEYPANNLGAPLGETALEFLLSNGPTDDLAFWRRIGSSISLTKLARLPNSDMPALGAAVVANLDRLNARRLGVRPTQNQLLDSPFTGEWRIRGEALELAVDNFTALFGMKAEHITPLAPQSDGIRKDTFDDRTVTRSVQKLGFKARGLTVSVSADQDAEQGKQDLKDNDNIDQLALPTALVSDATVVLSGKNFDLDYSTTTGSLHTSSQLDLRSLVEHGIPLLWDIDPQGSEAIQVMLDDNANMMNVDRPPTLFDDA